MKCIEKKKGYQIIAISLIVLSFALYVVMPFNACLPFSAGTIAGITLAMIIVSEIIFWIGSLMIGREVVLRIRKKLSIMRFINYIIVRMEEK
jgi:hypothetical protein